MENQPQMHVNMPVPWNQVGSHLAFLQPEVVIVHTLQPLWLKFLGRWQCLSRKPHKIALSRCGFGACSFCAMPLTHTQSLIT